MPTYIIRAEIPDPNKPFYRQTLRDIEEFEKKHPKQKIPNYK